MSKAATLRPLADRLSPVQREHLRSMIDPDSGQVLFWHPWGAERRTVAVLCRRGLLRVALGTSHGTSYELTPEGEALARGLRREADRGE